MCYMDLQSACDAQQWRVDGRQRGVEARQNRFDALQSGFDALRRRVEARQGGVEGRQIYIAAALSPASGLTMKARATSSLRLSLSSSLSDPPSLKPDAFSLRTAMTHIVPRNRDEMIEFYRLHLPAWQADPARIGLTVEQVAQIAALVAEAEEAEFEATQARNLAQRKTEQLNVKADRLRRHGAAAMAMIRAKARTSDEIEVYEQAAIPMPRQPRPTPPPE